MHFNPLRNPVAHPGSVFRMEHCWVHDGNGGNGVKSRAERNEIYYNWIEGSYYHELELIGPDGMDESLARERPPAGGGVEASAQAAAKAAQAAKLRAADSAA